MLGMTCKIKVNFNLIIFYNFYIKQTKYIGIVSTRLNIISILNEKFLRTRYIIIGTQSLIIL